MKIPDTLCDELLESVTDVLRDACGPDGYISDMKSHTVSADKLRRLNTAITAIDLEAPVANYPTEVAA